jgi:hypothetical protein
VGRGGVPLSAFDQVAEENFDFGGVRNLNGDGVTSRNWGEDVDSFCFHGAGKIALKITDAFHPDSGSWIEFVAGDGGPAGDVARTYLDIEMGKSFNDALLVGLEFVFREGRANILL